MGKRNAYQTFLLDAANKHVGALQSLVDSKDRMEEANAWLNKCRLKYAHTVDRFAAKLKADARLDRLNPVEIIEVTPAETPEESD